MTPSTTESSSCDSVCLGLAIGLVLGVVLIAAIVVAVVFLWQRRKKASAARRTSKGPHISNITVIPDYAVDESQYEYVNPISCLLYTSPSPRD